MFTFFGGIDFSGAKEPLSTLWSALGEERDGKLCILALQPHPFRADLCHHVAGGWRKGVADEHARVLWGGDFPFGIPRDAARLLLGGDFTWRETAAWVADRPADEVRAAAAEYQKTPRRTDTGGAMAPFDLRLYKQTVEGLRWLHELLENADVSILPQRPAPDAGTTLIEVYPSITSTDLGLRCRRTPSRPGEVRARPAALRTYLEFDHPSLEATAVALEDAWDAVLACLTAYLARHDLDQPRRLGAPEDTLALEGWIYRVPEAV
jgi:hypothetical protein